MNKRYEAITGLRTIGTIGILMMHIRGNAHYVIGSYWYDTFVASFSNFVFLFMIISAFSMCCGYFEKIKEGKIQLENFYKKRFSRIWPYFALLVILDFIASPSRESLYESFANLTIAFGLLPNANISVIGVGWFLGIVFLFYMLFPYFVFIIGNIKRAWFSFFLAVIFHYLCLIYFFDNDHIGVDFSGRVNIIYCMPYFLSGGLIYLYKEKLEKWAEKYQWTILFTLIVLIFMYFKVKTSIIIMLPLFSLMLIYSLGKNRKILCNSITCFISNISLEIYLGHMLVYRVVEKIGLLHIIKIDTVAYFFTVVLVLSGTILFALFTNKILERLRITYIIYQHTKYGKK